MVSVLHPSAIAPMIEQGYVQTAAAIAPPHPGPPAPIADEHVEPLLDLAGEVTALIGADGLLIASPLRDGRATVLASTGACATTERGEALLALLARGDPGAAARPAPAWLKVGAASPGAEVLHAGVTTPDFAIDMLALYETSDAAIRARGCEQVTRLLPLLRSSLALWAERTRAQAQARGLAEAVNHADVGVLLVNARGQLMLANAVAESLMARQDGLRRSGTLLSGGRLPDTLRLQTAIDHVVGGGGTARGRGTAPVIALSRADRRPLLVAIVATEQPPAGAEDCAAILYVFDPAQELRRLIEPVCKLYGLSPVETRLTCLLADALSLADAAAAMRVREQTARSYLKQIFLKTDTNRQAELVWLMLKSAVRVAPTCRTSFV
ncbi:hypothetical protein [Sphingomonas sp. BK580]|uniref:helix-turn-helix transcriptional regulator n=1 Tax=Sphingomonas sp. BK580 TaxID=2586972 RepID=UPI001618A3F0|nr:hypothetical protein [Sphingomonas sp. BK580]MBB3695678.1 DNA-binding CsgD family transcriptional regulator [Sphingomonas sp. BK580]